jgi:5-methylcytosine-specific restriction protein A
MSFTVRAVLVDHVDPHKGDMVKFWNRDMWQSSCRWHHDVVKKRLEAMLDRGEVAVADLWLTSAAAVALSILMRGQR